MTYTPNAGKEKEATYIEYEYGGSPWVGFIKPPILVYVDKDKPSPDPAKRMLWGTRKDGSMVSDYKGFFTRKRTIKFKYSIEGAWTHNEETKMKLAALMRYIR